LVPAACSAILVIFWPSVCTQFPIFFAPLLCDFDLVASGLQSPVPFREQLSPVNFSCWDFWSSVCCCARIAARAIFSSSLFVLLAAQTAVLVGLLCFIDFVFLIVCGLLQGEAGCVIELSDQKT
jgi:hypothetical protein